MKRQSGNHVTCRGRQRATDVVKRSYRTYALLIERAYYWLRVWLTNAFGCLASGMLDHLICDKLMEQHSSGPSTKLCPAIVITSFVLPENMT